MACLFPLWTIRDHPAVDRRVIHVDPTFQHACDMARAQGIRHVSADAHEHDVLWKMGPLEAHRRRRSPLLFTFIYERRIYLKISSNKTCNKT